MNETRDEGSSAANAPAIRPRGLITMPRVLAIGASTGGPQALSLLLSKLSPHLDKLPVLIVLHMPPDFTDVVSGHIERATGRPTRAARNGEKIRPGEIYFAPGNHHLKVARLDTTPILIHCDSPPENFCRPAVNVLFRSVAQVYGPTSLGIVLTGMGSDGLDGARALVEAGGTVIAQDKASSLVWGMPGAVAQEGLAAAVLPIDSMAAHLTALLRTRSAGVAA
ncbi:MAG: chemotaxis protein CheB [Methylobacteriaceae bacterium]|nr:chemotaxis protein CheB [Methylobacteriaceae bacterium]